ncbi:MAG: FAD-binding oxidoreductase [Gammaproteobacteria bacterium]
MQNNGNLMIEAIGAWRAAIGSEYVNTGLAERKAAETATYATDQHVPVILRPKNRTEVQDCVRIANRYRTPLYPISTGKNWGYGSRVPISDGCALLDLGRLNRIVDFDERLAFITVEPGVTQQQAFDFLGAREAELFLGMTGGPRDSSLIGATLERGVAKGPYGDRFAHVAGMEVILPTGECVCTGMGRFDGARSANSHRWGVGPYLDGLFTQSNLGIVTRMSFWLSPVAPNFQICLFTVEDDSRLEALFDSLRGLLLRGVLNTAFVLSNDYRIFSYSQQYPFEESGGHTPLPLEIREKLRNQWQSGLWFCELALYSACAEQARVERRIIRESLCAHVERLHFVDDELMQASDSELNQVLPGYDPQEVRLWFARNGQRGVPSDANLSMAYWRKRNPLPAQADLDRDRCGFIWLAPVTPMLGECIREAVNLVESTCLKHGYEPSIALNCIDARNVYITTAIVYDREVAGEDARAMACYEDLLTRLIGAGYPPYRLGTHAMASLPPARDDYGYLLRALKQALDPNDILAPGRYDFRHEWPR